MVECLNQDIRWAGVVVTPLQRGSRCILQPQPTGPTQSIIHQGEWDSKNFQGFWDTNRSPNPGQTTRPRHCQQRKKKRKKKKENEKRTCRIVDYPFLADHKIKIKESENIYKYMDIATEQKKKNNPKQIMEHVSDGDTTCDGFSRNNLQRLCLVRFYSISTIEGHSVPYLIHTYIYISYIYDF